eukprot:scaffold200192_cov51-Attheya_sp.AAC.1
MHSYYLFTRRSFVIPLTVVECLHLDVQSLLPIRREKYVFRVHLFSQLEKVVQFIVGIKATVDHSSGPLILVLAPMAAEINVFVVQ